MVFARLIQENIQFYKPWLWYKKKIKKSMLKVRLPKKGDSFYIDGYPRSGNTFCLAFTKIAFPQAEYAHHLHSLAPLKLALSNNIPTIVLLRNPKECITSLAILKDHYKNNYSNNIKNLEYLIDNYIRYYQYVRENKEKMKLLTFETIVDLPALLGFFQNALKLNVDISEKQLKEIKETYMKRQMSKPIERKNNPSKEKNKQKDKIFEMIFKLKSFEQANAVYQSLLNEEPNKN